MSSEFLEKDIVYVSSSNRISGISNDFTIDLSSQIRVPNNYDSATLLSASIPLSYYLFTEANNQFDVIESKSQTTITIPLGNYSITQLVVLLRTAFAECAFTYTINFSVNTGKITFSVSGNDEQPILDFTDNSPYSILGFTKAAYEFVSNTLTSPNVVNVQPTSTIELMTDMVERSVLSVIIPNASNFSVINYNEQNPAFASHSLARTNFQSAHFYLINGNTGEPLNLNGLDFNFVFAIYKKNSYYKTMLIDKQLEMLERNITDELD
jgi:hypothetical protein